MKRGGGGEGGEEEKERKKQRTKDRNKERKKMNEDKDFLLFHFYFPFVRVQAMRLTTNDSAFWQTNRRFFIDQLFKD